MLLSSIAHRGDEVRVGLDWPVTPLMSRGRLYRGFDAILIPETLRQATIAAAHLAFGVPMREQFLMGAMRFSVVDAGFMAAGCAGAELVGRVRFDDVTYRHGVLRRARVSLVVGLLHVVAVAEAGLQCVDEVTYRRMRSRRPTLTVTPGAAAGPPVSPALVGRRSPAEVLLCELSFPDGPADGWLLRADPSNGELFDHPVDHVPGMLQIEACRQAALAWAATGPGDGDCFAGCDLLFRRIVEVDEPAWCRVLPGDRHNVAVEIAPFGAPPSTLGFVTFVGAPTGRARPPAGDDSRALSEWWQ